MESWLPLRSLIASIIFISSTAGAVEPNKESIYQTTSRWRTSTGKSIQLRELGGKPVLITMVYTKCAHTCPMMVAKLKTIEKAIGDIPDLGIVLVSFDHKNDTPEEMAKFAKKNKLDAARWAILSANNSGATRELAALLDISYKLEKSGEYSHSNLIAVLDKEGVIRASLNGIASDHTGLVALVAGLK